MCVCYTTCVALSGFKGESKGKGKNGKGKGDAGGPGRVRCIGKPRGWKIHDIDRALIVIDMYECTCIYIYIYDMINIIIIFYLIMIYVYIYRVLMS